MMRSQDRLINRVIKLINYYNCTGGKVKIRDSGTCDEFYNQTITVDYPNYSSNIAVNYNFKENYLHVHTFRGKVDCIIRENLKSANYNLTEIFDHVLMIMAFVQEIKNQL